MLWLTYFPTKQQYPYPFTDIDHVTILLTCNKILTLSMGATAVLDIAAAVPPVAKSTKNFFASNFLTLFNTLTSFLGAPSFPVTTNNLIRQLLAVQP